MYNYTMRQLMFDIHMVARRAVIDERINFLSVRVPIWNIKWAKEILYLKMPVGCGWEVKSLSFIEHFTQWRVTFNVLYGSAMQWPEIKTPPSGALIAKLGSGARKWG